MAEISRAAQSDDDWAAAPAPEPVARTERPGDPTRVINALSRIQEDIQRLSRFSPGAARILLDGLRGQEVAGLVAVIQDMRRDLAATEAYLAREVGRDDMAPREGTLPDGRLFSVKKGQDRKAWDHDAWKAAVREAVLSQVGLRFAVDPNTGEQVDLQQVANMVQNVHGSTAPKVTEMKRLNVDPGDYCETVPGPWAVKISAPGAKDDE